MLEDREVNLKECPVPVDEEMRWHAWNYAEYVNGLKAEKHIIHIEKKIPLWYMPERNARIDVAIQNYRHLHIVDYKYGEGIVVNPVENLQGAIYARSILEWIMKENPKITITKDYKITIHIYQPRGREAADAPAHVWETTWEELKTFTDERVTIPAVVVQTKGTELVFAPSDKACQWCPAKGFCEARRMSLTAGIEALTTIEEGPKSLPLTDTLSIKQIAAVVEHGDNIIKWVKDVQGYALDLATAGKKIPGQKLVLSRGGNRYWTDQVAAGDVLLANTILKKEEIWEQKLIGPASLEKLLGKNKFPAELLDYIGKPEGKPVLAPLDDPRPEVGAALLESDGFGVVEGEGK